MLAFPIAVAPLSTCSYMPSYLAISGSTWLYIPLLYKALPLLYLALPLLYLALPLLYLTAPDALAASFSTGCRIVMVHSLPWISEEWKEGTWRLILCQDEWTCYSLPNSCCSSLYLQLYPVLPALPLLYLALPSSTWLYLCSTWLYLCSTCALPGSTCALPGSTCVLPGSTSALPGYTWLYLCSTWLYLALPGSTCALPGSTSALPGYTSDQPGSASALPHVS